MATKKIPIGLNPTEAELEHRVDVMMEPVRVKTSKDSAEPASAVIPAAAPIDIFSDPRTAPAVPDGLLAKLEGEPAKPAPTTEPKSIAVTDHDSGEEIISKPSAPVLQTDPPTVEAALPAEEIIPEPTPVTPGPALVVPQLVKYAPTTIIPKNPVAPDATGAAISDISIPEIQIDDAKTDAAVDEITARESDDLLAAQDELQKMTMGGAVKAARSDKKPRRRVRKRWVLLTVLLLTILLVAAFPSSRYKAAGLIIKKDLQIRVIDKTTGAPVSKAAIVIDGQNMMTDGDGKASFNLGVGQRNVSVSKQYYTSSSAGAFVNFGGVEPLTISLVATGRQVPITVLDRFTNKPVSGAEINILNTSAKTNQAGKTNIVLPAGTPTVNARITAGGFNNAQVKVRITDSQIPENIFKLTASGKVYFLSNEKGTIDVVKTNLDGTDRKTVLKGTGKEDPNTTLLLASRDWRYVALKAQRSSTQASLFMIDGSTDKLIEFDSGDANFTPIGWHENNFIYDVVRNSVANSQVGRELIRSYDAGRGQLNQLDQNQTEGEGTSYIYQGFYSFYLLGDQLVYNTQWYSSGGADLAKKNNTIRGIQVNGQNKKDYQTIGASGTGYVQSALSAPREIIYGAYNTLDNKNRFYEFKDNTVKESTNVNQASFNKLYPSYVVSPSGRQSVWSELRDGKQTVLLGDADAANSRMMANLAGYKAYGWYSDNYLLVSKNNSEMYIVASTGNSAPQKITDYYKSAQNQNGYGYGGL